MKKSKDFSTLYKKSYFSDRKNNSLRVNSFNLERKFINKYISKGVLLDIGCSTGELLNTIQWEGERYGMEISEYAIEKAIANGISFDKDINSEKDFFDIIIFRGTIQHLDQPFLYIEKAYKALRKGGYVFYLATPNINSLYYKIWNDLPALDSRKNFFLPSEKILTNVMEIYGFELIQKEFPYINSPYSNPIKDHLKFILKIFGSNVEFPFWRNMMNLCYIKK